MNIAQLLYYISDRPSLLLDYSNIKTDKYGSDKPRFNTTYWQPNIVVGTTTYYKCIEMHPRDRSFAKSKFKIEDNPKLFTCKFGMASQDSNKNAIGEFIGRIYVDGIQAWPSDDANGIVKGTSINAPLYEVSIPISIEARSIEFVVESLLSASADHAVWVDPKFN